MFEFSKSIRELKPKEEHLR